MTDAPPYWRTKRLSEMSAPEWEALCDGCGKCCLVLLEDEDTGEIAETSLHCQLFDPEARRCTAYRDRHRLVPTCVKVTPENVPALSWMPRSCAYRRLSEGRGLPDWHPLVTGRAESVAEAGQAAGRDGPLTNEARVRARDLWRYVTEVRG